MNKINKMWTMICKSASRFEEVTTAKVNTIVLEPTGDEGTDYWIKVQVPRSGEQYCIGLASGWVAPEGNCHPLTMRLFVQLVEYWNDTHPTNRSNLNHMTELLNDDASSVVPNEHG